MRATQRDMVVASAHCAAGRDVGGPLRRRAVTRPDRLDAVRARTAGVTTASEAHSLLLEARALETEAHELASRLAAIAHELKTGEPF